MRAIDADALDKFLEDAEISIVHGRNNGSDTIWLKWDARTGRFYDSYRHEEFTV